MKVPFGNMIFDIINNRELQPIVTKVFMGGRHLNFFLVFLTQFYFVEIKDIRLNSTHYFILKVKNKLEFQQIEVNNLSNVDFE